jgi:hypothetical protein
MQEDHKFEKKKKKKKLILEYEYKIYNKLFFFT